MLKDNIENKMAILFGLVLLLIGVFCEVESAHYKKHIILCNHEKKIN